MLVINQSVFHPNAGINQSVFHRNAGNQSISQSVFHQNAGNQLDFHPNAHKQSISFPITMPVIYQQVFRRPEIYQTVSN